MRLLERRLTKQAGIPWTSVEEEIVLVDYREGELVRLNPVGAAIWGAIDGRRTVQEIVLQIRSIFEVSEAQANRDVRKFVKRLLRCELVQDTTQS